MAKTPDRFPGPREEEEVRYIEQTSLPTVDGALRYFDGAFRFKDADGVKTLRLRQLAEFLSDGPGEGFTGGFFEQTSSLTSPFDSILPTNQVWWTDATKTEKIVEREVTWDTGVQRPTQIVWTVYATGGAVLATVTDSFDYSGIFPARTRTIS